MPEPMQAAHSHMPSPPSPAHSLRTPAHGRPHTLRAHSHIHTLLHSLHTSRPHTLPAHPHTPIHSLHTRCSHTLPHSCTTPHIGHPHTLLHVCHPPTLPHTICTLPAHPHTRATPRTHSCTLTQFCTLPHSLHTPTCSHTVLPGVPQPHTQSHMHRWSWDGHLDSPSVEHSALGHGTAPTSSVFHLPETSACMCVFSASNAIFKLQNHFTLVACNSNLLACFSSPERPCQSSTPVRLC